VIPAEKIKVHYPARRKDGEIVAHSVVYCLIMANGSNVYQHDLTFIISRSDVFIIMGGSGSLRIVNCYKVTLPPI